MITIPVDTRIIGEIKSKGPICIEGHVSGKGEINGYLLLGTSCLWQGDVVAESIFIEGRIEGNIIAKKQISIASGAVINGDIFCPNILIVSGAVINGQLNMKKPEAPIQFIGQSSQTTKHTEQDKQKAIA